VNSSKGNNYQAKIKSVAELKQILGSRPRDKNVVMCHGTFDIVHPGHIRHLTYASEEADILVASLTGDAHITKDNFRPFVPEELRAINLAAMEMVDYVIIDPNPTPLENLRLLQPDYFAKGYDYFSEGVHPKTQEEIEVLESYGGEIIYTPGDVVYSSSRLINLEPPSIAAEKLQLLMASDDLVMDDLRQTLDKFSQLKVHVIGDTIVDSYAYCSLIGGGTKTPTLSVKYEDQVDYTGGAAVVAKHIRQAGAQVRFTSVLGDDPFKDFVLKDLESCGIESDISIDSTRPTTQKLAFIADDYRLLKVDKLDNRAIGDKILAELENSLTASDANAFVFSDFRHGIFSPRTIEQLVACVPAGVLKVADSQVASRWGNILDFQGFDLITPNEREARFALGDQDSVVRPLALKLYEQAQCQYLILKLGGRGIITYRSSTPKDFRAFFTVDSFVDRIVDKVGTGDALLSYATLSLKATDSPVIASILGSMAAAVACESEGNCPVDPDDVLKKIDAVEKQINYG
jgi:rfaE bifunctional protein kinase chain/domain